MLWVALSVLLALLIGVVVYAAALFNNFTRMLAVPIGWLAAFIVFVVVI